VSPPRLDDARVRLAAFRWLAEQTALTAGEPLKRAVLQQGFELDGRRVPLLGPQGIFKPEVLPELPLSITTTPDSPYADAFGPEGVLQYRYRGTDPLHHENVGMRKAMERRVPLVYFHGLVPGQYMAAWPVLVVGDDRKALAFRIEVDDAAQAERSLALGVHSAVAESLDEGRRRYVTSTVMRRIHQAAFRERVLAAYQSQCALCHLRHRELLDAAHIIPDSEPDGEAHVRNGIALCKLHHAAFDKFFLGIRPDYQIVIRSDVRRESDGPMLLHGLQGMHGTKLLLPRGAFSQPDVALLDRRFRLFQDHDPAA
jgi:putative restriction endonuclease